VTVARLQIVPLLIIVVLGPAGCFWILLAIQRETTRRAER